jgi:hypothetical protein
MNNKLLHQRRYSEVGNEMRDILRNSEKDIGVMINAETFFLKPLTCKGFSSDEVWYTIRGLIEKGFLSFWDGSSDNYEEIKLTQKGRDNWALKKDAINTEEKIEAKEPPRVFISYSRTNMNGSDNEENIKWVENLALTLRKDYGVDAIIDEIKLKLGDNIDEFMNNGIKNDSVRAILIVCDKNYNLKVEKKKGDVWTEFQMITQEIEKNTGKVIPIIKELYKNNENYLPDILKRILAVDLSKNDILKYKKEFRALVRRIHNIEKKLPPFGKIPDLELEGCFVDADQISDWAVESVNNLRKLGAFYKNDDYLFKPKEFINRGESAKVLVITAKLPEDTTGAPHFNDIKIANECYSFVETLYNNGTVGGVDSNVSNALDFNDFFTYRPDDALTRDEAAKIIVDAFDLETAYAGTPPNFSDVSSNYWSYDYVETAYAHGIFNGFSNGNFKPKTKISKEEFAVFVQAAMKAGRGRRDDYHTGTASNTNVVSVSI